MSKRMNSWSPYRIYFNIYLHLNIEYFGRIKFSPEFEEKVNKHEEYLRNGV